jgi:hypothetical protein
MVVTKETYAAPAPWLAGTLADLFESALISSGLMTGWFDSFANGLIEHRVIQIQYDSTKNFGTCYYWFAFTTTFVGVSISAGWDAATHVPTGVQFNDFFSTLTNTVNNHFALTTPLTNSTEINVVRYTSGENPAYSIFVIRNGADPHVFMIAPPSVPIVSWLDLNIHFFHHFFQIICDVSPTGVSSNATVNFRDVWRFRRSYADSINVGAQTGITSYRQTRLQVGYRSDSYSPGSITTSIPGQNNISVPYRLLRTGLPYTDNYTPVLFGISYSFYVNQPLPSDFAIYFPYTLTAFAFGDDIIVNPGIEEWEVLEFANNNSNEVSNPLLLARLI